MVWGLFPVDPLPGILRTTPNDRLFTVMFVNALRYFLRGISTSTLYAFGNGVSILLVLVGLPFEILYTATSLRDFENFLSTLSFRKLAPANLTPIRVISSER